MQGPAAYNSELTTRRAAATSERGEARQVGSNFNMAPNAGQAREPVRFRSLNHGGERTEIKEIVAFHLVEVAAQ